MENRIILITYLLIFIISLLLGWLFFSNLYKQRSNEQRLELATPILNNLGVNVVVLGTEWCSYCEKTRKYLNQNMISYRWIDIEKNDRNKKMYDSFEAKGIPLIITKDSIIEGHKINELKKIRN